jgi:hypothetical protein
MNLRDHLHPVYLQPIKNAARRYTNSPNCRQFKPITAVGLRADLAGGARRKDSDTDGPFNLSS